MINLLTLMFVRIKRVGKNSWLVLRRFTNLVLFGAGLYIVIPFAIIGLTIERILRLPRFKK